MRLNIFNVAIFIIGHLLGLLAYIHGYKVHSIAWMVAGMLVIASPVSIWPRAYD